MSVNLTPPQEAILLCLNYGIFVVPESLPQIATSDFYGEDLTVEETQTALQECLNWGWAQIVDEQATSRITEDLRTRQILGPIYSMPYVGCVDFTTAGAEVWVARQAEKHPEPEPFAYMITSELPGPDGKDDLTTSNLYYWKEQLYCESKEGFEDVWREHREQGTVFLSSRIVPIGPWCVYWWKRFPSGYRLELELCGNDIYFH